jgi:hypothetical protein
VLTELDVSGIYWRSSSRDKGDGVGFAQELSVGLRDNGALSSLYLKSNGLLNKKSGEALAGVLKANSVLTELDISNNYEEYDKSSQDGAGFAHALAVGLVDNGAILCESGSLYTEKLKPSPEYLQLFQKVASGQATIQDNVALERLEGQQVYVCGCCGKLKAEHHDNGAMTSLHVGKNRIPEKEMKEIIFLAMHNESMKVLCEVPIKDKSLTELDVSGKSLGAEGALVVAEYLRDNRARRARALSLLCSNHSGKSLGAEGAVVVAEYLRNNRAMTSLNLASNGLRAAGAKIVAEAIKVTKCTPAIILTLFSCPSDFYQLLLFAIIPRTWGAYRR